MNVVVVLEHRFWRTPDGAVWSPTGCSYRFWTRYLEEFDSVRVVARVAEVRAAESQWVRANGPDVSFAAIPYYVGPREYLKMRGAVRRAVQAAFEPGDAVILRVGSVLADALLPVLKAGRHPYAVEVVSDPWDVFSPGAVRHPLRPLFRRWFSHRLRAQCAGAGAAAYVTEDALQRRYPPAPGVPTTGFSDVELPDAAFVGAPRPPRGRAKSATLIMVGTLEQLYKAPDVLVEAVGLGVRDGLDLRLMFVGDGGHRAMLRERADALGLGERVRFLGWLPGGEEVRRKLDQSEVFVLPSRQEGLPRAMIEAMARALPCIGSTVGGIPELLPPEDMVPPNDPAALAAKIGEVVSDLPRMARMSARNFEKAGQYREEALAARRRAFYRNVSVMTRRAAGQPARVPTMPGVIR